MLSIGSRIRFTPDFILELDVLGVYGLPLSEIAKQIGMGLTLVPSRDQHLGQHSVTDRRIQHDC